ncbi:hypothetical protein NE237_016545 [Protea cynaroides]|uniref:Uncharacterized protein n=1 Tax=Protea cynaroides TaxID=273540 RepID=A0A9Q0K6A4_9MAGN|nr:hypothetical protein NE237_016545 [Protea cynaroides]
MTATQQPVPIDELRGDDMKSSCKKKKKEEGRDQMEGHISRMIEEIFGEEVSAEEKVVPERKKRFQSIAYIYMTTKPVNSIHSKKMSLMAESQSLRRTMTATDQQPPIDELRGDDMKRSCNRKKKEEGRDQIEGHISRMIEEIFGEEVSAEEKVVRQKKKRFQSIAYIYMTTKPVNAIHSKKMRC